MESCNLISKGKKQIKLDVKCNNIKSDYFLIKVFNNLEKKRALKIINYNKNIKKNKYKY